MSAEPIQAHTERLDALTVFAAARDAAGCRGVPVARVLVLVLAATRRPQEVLQAACDELARNPEAGRASPLKWEPVPSPLPLSDVQVWSRLLGLIGDALHRDPSQWAAWARYRALQHGAWWLADAEPLARRDGHLMRQLGGLRLAPAAFDGERLRAEIVPGASGPGESCGDVLRLTWEETGRLVAQSKPGEFGAVDLNADPE